MDANSKEENLAAKADKLENLVEETGKKGWQFLRSVWFWVIAGPVNLLIAALVIAWFFPWIFLNFPVAPAGIEKYPKVILIDKFRQGGYAYENGVCKKRFVVLTGDGEHDTPTGTFRVTKKDKDYVSKKYKVPMPYSVFFIESHGVAMHASFAVGPKWLLKHWSFHHPYIGSHGCVRLTTFGARQMFNFAENGTPVIVIDSRK
jgi:L,D-transpeptidase catalytic domain